MSFLSFLSAHRLHWGSHRVPEDSLAVQLDRVLHEHPAANEADSFSLEAESGFRPAAAGVRSVFYVGLIDESGP